MVCAPPVCAQAIAAKAHSQTIKSIAVEKRWVVTKRRILSPLAASKTLERVWREQGPGPYRDALVLLEAAVDDAWEVPFPPTPPTALYSTVDAVPC